VLELCGDEFERESAPVEVVLIAYGCGFGRSSGLTGDDGRGKMGGGTEEAVAMEKGTFALD
jgi:hypothetical protein